MGSCDSQRVPTKRAVAAVAVVAGLALLGASCGSDGTSPDNGGAPALVERLTEIDDTDVERLSVEVTSEYPHDPTAFTQGLLADGGEVYESTGLYGESTLRSVDLASGDVTAVIDLGADLFGEGLEVVGDRFIQLTWREGTALVYDRDTLELVDRYSYSTEGWGICLDADRLVMTDGTATAYQRDPATFELLDQVTVTLDGEPLWGLNELECVDGTVWANVRPTDYIVAFDPDTGKIGAVVDASGLLDADEQTTAGVLNGIAHIDGTDRFLITGKLWPSVFEVRFVPGQRSAP